jgi:hypothetical protein
MSTVRCRSWPTAKEFANEPEENCVETIPRKDEIVQVEDDVDPILAEFGQEVIQTLKRTDLTMPTAERSLNVWYEIPFEPTDLSWRDEPGKPRMGPRGAGDGDGCGGFIY